MRDTMNKTFTMLILICAAAGAAWASQPVNETIPVAPGSEISVENLAGSLTFEGWDSAMLEVTGTLGDGVERLDIDVDEDGEIYLEVEFDEDLPRQADPIHRPHDPVAGRLTFERRDRERIDLGVGHEGWS